MGTIKQFDIYFGELSFADKTGSKKRPQVLIEVFDDNDSVFVLGIYTYRSWFKDKEKINSFHEIIDWQQAGLKHRSFINIDNIYELKLQDFMKYKRIGSLSTKDRQRIIQKLGV